MRKISETPWVKVYIGLGSNVGDREKFLREAIRSLKELEGFKVRRVSRFFETEPVGITEQGLFLNGVLEGETILSPHDLLLDLKIIEKKAGRMQTEKWGPREIDLDLLFYGDLVLEEEALTIPHPRLQERDFVLVPLSELNETLIHPKLKKSVKTLLTESKGFHASHPKPYSVTNGREAV